jgi:hypothetical protein
LTVERDGYVPLEWNPGSYWINHERTLFLSPVTLARGPSDE